MGRVAAVLAAIATAGVFAAPVHAAGFTDYRQAAGDQYSVTQTAASSGQSPASARRPTATKKRKTSASRKGSTKGANAGNGVHARRPLAVAAPTHAVRAARGQLPFTGGPVGVLVLIALILLAAGFLLAAATRLRRQAEQPPTA